jgi:IclR family acetate operon transcriptional repressor
MTRLVRLQGLPKATDRTLTTLDALRAELKTIRARGFAIDDEEFAIGLRCVAGPVFDEHGTPLGSISLSGPSARVVDTRIEALGARVIEAARITTIDIGGRPGRSQP